MKLAIFGATGKTGMPLVEQAIEKGHTVKILVRSTSKTVKATDAVEVIVGDALDEKSVDDTIANTDAVLCVLGHAANSPDNILEQSAKLIVKSMREHMVKLIIVLSMESVTEAEDPKQSYYQKFSSFATRTSISALWTDSANQAKVIRDAPRDEIEYVIIRGPRLTEGKHTGKYKTAYHFNYGMYMTSTISRADVADFMLKILETKEYLNRCPCIMY
jgi:putative NADH-flavin reductase